MVGESLVNIFPGKNESVNNFKIIQCHCGMGKGHAAGDHLSFCRFKELFSCYIFLKLMFLNITQSNVNN